MLADSNDILGGIENQRYKDVITFIYMVTESCSIRLAEINQITELEELDKILESDEKFCNFVDLSSEINTRKEKLEKDKLRF